MALAAAQCAARGKRHDDAQAQLAEAGEIAARIGERDGMRMHFGPTNVAVWRLAVGVELGEGGRVYESATRTPVDVVALNSQERSSALSFDLARALVQDGAHRDAEAIRHLDPADRLARLASVMIRSPGTWFLRWTGGLGGGYGSWTVSVIALVSTARAHGV